MDNGPPTVRNKAKISRSGAKLSIMMFHLFLQHSITNYCLVPAGMENACIGCSFPLEVCDTGVDRIPGKYKASIKVDVSSNGSYLSWFKNA